MHNSFIADTSDRMNSAPLTVLHTTSNIETIKREYIVELFEEDSLMSMTNFVVAAEHIKEAGNHKNIKHLLFTLKRR